MGGLRFRIAVMAAALLLAGAGLVAAFAYLSVALYAYLAAMFGPVVSALLCAGAAILFSIIVLVLGKVAARRRAKQKDEAVALLGALLGQELRGLTETSPTKRLLLALAAGFAVGVSPRLRKVLAGLL